MKWAMTLASRPAARRRPHDVPVVSDVGRGGGEGFHEFLNPGPGIGSNLRQTHKIAVRSGAGQGSGGERPEPDRSAARRRFRVRERHLRRIDSPAVRPGDRKGHPGRAAGRVSWRAIRWSTSARASTTDWFHAVDSSEMSFKMAGVARVQGRLWRARARRSSSR